MARPGAPGVGAWVVVAMLLACRAAADSVPYRHIPSKRYDVEHWVTSAESLIARAAGDLHRCYAELGRGFVHRWRSKWGGACGPLRHALSCAAHPDHADLVTCSGHHLQYNLAQLATPGKTTTSSKPEASLVTTCRSPPKAPPFAAGRLVQGPPGACTSFIPHPVWFMQRLDATNHWHHLEGLLTIWTSLAVSQGSKSVPATSYHSRSLLRQVAAEAPGDAQQQQRPLLQQHHMQVKGVGDGRGGGGRRPQGQAWCITIW